MYLLACGAGVVGNSVVVGILVVILVVVSGNHKSFINTSIVIQLFYYDIHLYDWLMKISNYAFVVTVI